MEEYLEAMIKEFESHNDHPEYNNDFDIDGTFESLQHTDLPTLRYEKHAQAILYGYSGNGQWNMLYGTQFYVVNYNGLWW